MATFNLMFVFLQQFTVQASDQRINERISQADVLISILRDRAAPVFTSEPYGGSVLETNVNGTGVAQATCFDTDLRVGLSLLEPNCSKCHLFHKYGQRFLANLISVILIFFYW